jgi:hypothetical protein
MYEWSESGKTNWAALSAQEKRLFVIANSAALIPLGLLFVPIAEDGYYFGLWLRGGDAAVAASSGFEGLRSSTVFGVLVVAAMACTLVSAIAWWRFSRLQDEMFHRIQNFIFSRLGVCAAAVVILSWLASLPGWLDGISAEKMLYGGALVAGLSSLEAWRRWG